MTVRLLLRDIFYSKEGMLPLIGLAFGEYVALRFSVKSKVRGDLEIYHAYLKDSNSRTNFSEDSLPKTPEESGDVCRLTDMW